MTLTPVERLDLAAFRMDPRVRAGVYRLLKPLGRRQQREVFWLVLELAEAER